MKMLFPCSVVAAAIALVTSSGAFAQTLYKLIDKKGKVTYSESPPKDFDGKVIRMDIDPNANTATLPKGSAFREGGTGARNANPNAGAGAEDAVRFAREKVEVAKKALADARENPEEGDVARIGNKGGGTRAQPSEDYLRRLETLERDVKAAEEELQKLQRGR